MRTTRLLATCVGAAIALLALACERPGSSGAAAPTSPSPTDASAALTPSQALVAASREPDPYARARKLAELIPTLGPDALPAVKELLLRSRALLGGGEFELLMRFWAAQEPSEATAWGFALVAPNQRVMAVQTAVEAWAKADPRAAKAGFEKQIHKDTDSNAVQAGQVALLRGSFQNDRAQLEQEIRSLGATAERENQILGYALVLAQADGSDAVVRWAEAVPADDEPYKRSVFYQVATLLSTFDPAAARRFCDANCDGPYGVTMRPVIALNQLRDGEDGKTLVEWLARAPENPDNDQTLASAYGHWVRRDRDAALAWMREKRESGSEPWLRKLTAPYARNLASSAPAEAIELAASVEPAATREALLIEIARTWRSQDEAAAEKWLAGSSLSEPAREAVRQAQPASPAGPPR